MTLSRILQRNAVIYHVNLEPHLISVKAEVCSKFAGDTHCHSNDMIVFVQCRCIPLDTGVICQVYIIPDHSLFSILYLCNIDYYWDISLWHIIVLLLCILFLAYKSDASSDSDPPKFYDICLPVDKNILKLLEMSYRSLPNVLREKSLRVQQNHCKYGGHATNNFL